MHKYDKDRGNSPKEKQNNKKYETQMHRKIAFSKKATRYKAINAIYNQL